MFMRTVQFSSNVARKDPFFRLRLIKKDPDDNKFVDCAFACQADYIVSDDSCGNRGSCGANEGS